MAEGPRKMLSITFEVFGKVQGVFFRKHTKKNADERMLVGWVKNTTQGTVVGQVQGHEERVKEMMTWLEKTGSPKSSIAKCDFTAQKTITKCEFNGFDIVKEKKSKAR